MKNGIYRTLFIVCFINFLGVSSSFAEVSSDGILTQSELSQCNEREQKLSQTAHQLKEHLKKLQTMKNKMTQLEHERAQEYADIDFQSQASVDEYNQTNNQLNQLSKEYTTEAKTLNASVKQYQADIKKLTADCDDKRYILNQ